MNSVRVESGIVSFSGALISFHTGILSNRPNLVSSVARSKRALIYWTEQAGESIANVSFTLVLPKLDSVRSISSETESQQYHSLANHAVISVSGLEQPSLLPKSVHKAFFTLLQCRLIYLCMQAVYFASFYPWRTVFSTSNLWSTTWSTLLSHLKWTTTGFT